MKAINKTNVLLAVVSVFALISAFFIVQNQFAGADVTVQQYGIPGDYKTYQFFATSTVQTVLATTTNATSTNITQWFNSRGELDKGYFVIAGAKKVNFFFTRGDKLGGGNVGGTQFRVQVTNKESPTESDWHYFNKLTQNLATSTVATTLAIATTSATSTLIMGLDLTSDTFYAARCLVQEVTDGSHECTASATW